MISRKFLKWLLISVLILFSTLIEILYFLKNERVQASSVDTSVTSEIITKEDGKQYKVYTLRGVKLNDDPYIFNGKSMQQLYEHNCGDNL